MAVTYRGELPDNNTKYGILTPVHAIGHKKYGDSNRYFYLWKCDCGNEKEYPVKEVLSGKCKSCGCLSYSINPRGWTKSRNPQISSWKYLYKRYRSSASYRKIKFEITIDDFILEASKNCSYCNANPRSLSKWNEPNTIKKARLFSYEELCLYEIKANGLDRIDSSKGYNPSNIVACCKRCNIAKGDMTADEFKSHIERVYKWLHQKE